MRLSLSSSAAPDATVRELAAACSRRGIEALALVEGNAHGLTTRVGPAAIEDARRVAADVGVEIIGFAPERFDAAEPGAAAELAARLGAPVIVPWESVGRDRLPEVAAAFERAGSTILLAVPSDPAVVERVRSGIDSLADPKVAGLAWEVRPEQDDAFHAASVIRSSGPYLRQVRLFGGGPEAARQSGHGVGALMAHLALARFAGPLVLMPSDPRYHYAWSAWLGRRGGWGCGSKQADPTLVSLTDPIHAA